MKIKLLLFALLAFFCQCIGADTGQTGENGVLKEGEFSAADSNIAYIGRTEVNSAGNVAFTYPGVQMRTLFSGTSATLLTKPGSGYFMVEIDDKEPFRVFSDKVTGEIPLASNLKDTVHTLIVTYANEGHRMRPEFRGLRLDAKGKLTGKPSLPKRKLEFIGNSITCGLGNVGDPTSKKFDYSMQNQYYTYEAILSRELDAQCQVVARSGIGIYRNNNGNVRGDTNNLPGVFPYTYFGMTGPKWDFSRYQPDVVFVNLGTNDTTHPKYYTDMLSEAFKKFLKTLRGHYPNAKIVLLTGTMLKGQRLQDVKDAEDAAVEDARQRGDTEIYRFDFTPDDGSLGKGVFNHPSAKRHQKMAEELLPFVRSITGWE